MNYLEWIQAVGICGAPAALIIWVLYRKKFGQRDND